MALLAFFIFIIIAIACNKIFVRPNRYVQGRQHIAQQHLDGKISEDEMNSRIRDWTKINRGY